MKRRYLFSYIPDNKTKSLKKYKILHNDYISDIILYQRKKKKKKERKKEEKKRKRKFKA